MVERNKSEQLPIYPTDFKGTMCRPNYFKQDGDTKHTAKKF